MIPKIIQKIKGNKIINSTVIQAQKVTYLNNDKSNLKLQQSCFQKLFQVISLESNFNIDVSNKHRFSYDMRLAQFCGRSKEIKKLHKFLGESNKLLIWAITGHAGCGKSRLALEFALKNYTSWVSLLFTYKNEEESIKKHLNYIDLEQLYPDKDLLIIVDYFLGRERIIRYLIDWMLLYTSRKIRILILEREKHSDNKNIDACNWSILLDEDNYIEDRKKSKLLYRKNFLELEPLSIASQKKIIKSTFKQFKMKYTYKDIKNIRKKLSEIDKGLYRPLYLQILTELWSSQEIKSKEDLLSLIIKREENRWERLLNSTQSKYYKKNSSYYTKSLIKLMVFVNSIGKFKLEDNLESPKRVQDYWNSIKELFINDKNSNSKSYIINSLIKKLNENNKYDDCILYNIQPDIIKEYLVLYFLQEIPINDYLEDVIIYDFKEFCKFICMCSEDFPNHNNLKILINNIPTEIQKFINLLNNTENTASKFADGLYSLIYSYGMLGKVNESLYFLNNLRELSKKYPENENIIWEYISGLYYFIYFYSEENKQPDKSVQFIDDLEIITKKHPQNQKYISLYVYSIYALIWSYSERKKTERCMFFFNKLEIIYKEYSNNKEIKETYFYAKKILKKYL